MLSTRTRPREMSPIGGDGSTIGDGAVLERLIRMRGACQALAVELADARRRLRSVEAELQRMKKRHGER